MRQVNSRCEDVERDHVELLGKRYNKYFSGSSSILVAAFFFLILLFSFRKDQNLDSDGKRGARQP